MNEILTTTLQAMHHDMVRMERIALNLANALTPGYKRDVVSVAGMARTSTAPTQTFQSLVEATPAQSASVAPAAPLRIVTDSRPGALRSTGQPLDLALTGPGYFEVQTSEGAAYTRQGTFRMDDRGRLVTAQGYPVMGVGGEIVLPNAAPSVDENGQIFDRSIPGVTDRTPVAQIKVARFERDVTLQKLGNGLLDLKGPGALTVETGRAGVRQGFLESSNVSSMEEMVQMIQTTRHFESMQKVALSYDEMIGTAVRKLGELS